MTGDGRPVLDPARVVTRSDIERAIDHQCLPDPEPGDAIFLRTGWNRLLRTDPKRFITHSPGVWLEETRWLASLQPSVCGTDSWCWGTASAEIVAGQYGACHQELVVRHGIRIAEGWRFDELADANVGCFVLVHNPIRAEGAVSTIAPGTAIANVR
jgi:kynurenine formamidase